VGPLLRHEPAAARKTRAVSEPARETTEERRKTGGATESEPVRAVETIEAEESGSERGDGLDGLDGGHGGPEKKKTDGARASESESGSGSGFCGRALQQRRCPGEYR
jgi:hypothetical protein